jgi:EAL domain-containing protein (putative c-di-GMP-specific phosphodiesterase class I)
VYQPIFSLESGQPIGFEGLVRPARDSGFMTADALFAAAEVSDRTVELDMACLEVVAAGVGKLEADQYVSFNLSPRTLETEQFRPADLRTLFRRNGLDPSQVVLELTEREAVEDMPRLRDNLAACRAMGMRIAADDVGAGNAGLRLLSEIRFDIVKIDLSLVQGGVLRDSALAVLGVLCDVADRSGAVVVAEGVETPEQLATVRALGLASGQGYLLARPDKTTSARVLDLDALAIREDPRILALAAPTGRAAPTRVPGAA